MVGSLLKAGEMIDRFGWVQQQAAEEPWGTQPAPGGLLEIQCAVRGTARRSSGAGCGE